MRIDAIWIWFVCAWLAVGIQGLLTYTKTTFDVAYQFTTLETNTFRIGSINLTTTNETNLPFISAQNFIKKDLEDTFNEEITVVVLNINKRSTLRYWKPIPGGSKNE